MHIHIYTYIHTYMYTSLSRPGLPVHSEPAHEEDEDPVRDHHGAGLGTTQNHPHLQTFSEFEVHSYITNEHANIINKPSKKLS